jgi:hypothetical protein
MPIVHFCLVTLSTAEKLVGCNADHLYLHSCEVKNGWSYTFTHPALNEYTGTNVFGEHFQYDHSHDHLTLVYS